MSENQKSAGISKVRWLLAAVMVLFDIVAVNLSYYLAILTRYYVADSLIAEAVPYLEAFYGFAPWYTVLCVAVFAAFRMYSSLWRYAGISDVNRVLLANLAALALQVAGTCLFFTRMPVSYYLVGALLQTAAVLVIRFAYRFYVMERSRAASSRKAADFRAMVVGTGETAGMVLRQLAGENAIRPVCILSCAGSPGTLMDGLPVVSGIGNMADALRKYNVNLVMIADSLLPQDTRSLVRETAKAAGAEAEDYSGCFSLAGAGLSLAGAAEYISGPVEVVVDGKSRRFDSAEQAVLALPGSYKVSALSARGNVPVITLAAGNQVLNDLSADWVRAQEQATGESVSFF